MSASGELQALIYARLIADAGVTAIVGQRVHDPAPPDEEAVYPFLSFGPSDVVEDDAECITGRVETVQIDCWSRSGGRKLEAKQLADAVKAALHLYDGEPTENALVEMRVTAIRVFNDPDGLTAHGVVTVQCIVEEEPEDA